MSVEIKPTKITEGKQFYELNWDFLTGIAERMSIGKKDGKYKRFKWKEGIDVEECKQAGFRHLLEVLKGNYEDDGQKYGHIFGVVANMMFIEHELKRKETKESNLFSNNE